MRCIIVGASEEHDIEYIKSIIKDNDYIIAADAGFEKLIALNIKPHLIVGDFDSCNKEIPKDVDTIRLPVCKDDTDMFYAVKEGIKLGYKSFIILGGTGGRLDHTLANLCVLEYLSDRGFENWLIDKNSKLFMMSEGEKTIHGSKGDNISIFPFGVDRCTVSYDGLLYELKKGTLYSNIGDGPMGVSNSFVGNIAKITVHSGKVLVLMSSV